MRSEKPNQVHRTQIRTATNRTQEYIQAARPIQQISHLLRAIRLLDEPRDVDSIATLLLVGLTADDGLSCPRAVLLLLDSDGRQLRGHGAVGMVPEPRPRLEDLLLDGLSKQVDRADVVCGEERPDNTATAIIQGLCYEVDRSPSAVVRALRESRAIHLEGLGVQEGADAHLARLLGSGTAVAFPLFTRGRTHGVVVVELPQTPEEEGAYVRQAIQDLACLAAEAMEGASKAECDGSGHGFLGVVEEISRVCLSANRLEEVLKLVVKRAAGLLNARIGIAWVHETEPDRLRLMVRCGAEAGDSSETLREAARLAERVIRERRTLRSVAGCGSGEHAAAFLCVPLVAFDEVVGAIALLGRTEDAAARERPFADRDQSQLELLASQAAVAVANARLFDRVRQSSSRIREAEKLILDTEKLAAIGAMSAKVTHEIRTPLSSIGGFARRIEKSLPENHPSRAHATVIVREIARLEAILAEQLDLAKTSKPRLRMVNLRALLRETVLLIRDEIDRKGVQFIEQGAGGIPSMLLDADRVKQVLLNILNNALASTRQGHTIRLRTRSSEGWVQIEIANNGEKMPGEILDQLFVPFATAREGGCGLGLAVADQIVKEHGGEIRVRTSKEWSVIFIVSLPIRINADRREKPDRRGGRDRRRAA